ncbi:hypothetical protein SLE2022_276220 [Rubroshorea leprosula]
MVAGLPEDRFTRTEQKQRRTSSSAVGGASAFSMGPSGLVTVLFGLFDHFLTSHLEWANGSRRMQFYLDLSEAHEAEGIIYYMKIRRT